MAHINYEMLMHQALRGLLIQLIEQTARDGLPGDHHFFITFDTTHEDVEMADWLFDTYPEEITIVIQHWFENLEVMEDGFTITLNVGDKPEPLFVPWDAITTFVDPSVEFGLKLITEPSDPVEESPMADIPVEDAPPKEDAQVVSLDSFRKE